MSIVGIDPGLHGGLACIGEPLPIAIEPMPVSGGEIDGHGLSLFLEAVKASLVCIEKVHSMPKQGVASTFKFGKGYGTILGVCAAMKIHVELVTPQAWKAVILAGTLKDKDAAIAWCRQAFPRVNLVQPGCRTPHDGMADSLAIAEYARRTYV